MLLRVFVRNFTHALSVFGVLCEQRFKEMDAFSASLCKLGQAVWNRLFRLGTSDPYHVNHSIGWRLISHFFLTSIRL